MTKTTGKKKINIAAIISAPIILFGVLAIASAIWYIRIFGDVGFDALIFTLFADMGSVESGMLVRYLWQAALPAVIITALLVFVLFAPLRRKIWVNIGKKRFVLFPFKKWVSVIISVVLSATLFLIGANKADLLDYVEYQLADSSEFIESNYADPNKTEIIFPEEKQNLIVIYCESMETAFLPREMGGGSQQNLIPGLTKLAQENVNFSNNETVGGFKSLFGSTWTSGALVAILSGMPNKSLNTNMDKQGSDGILPGATMITDILHENGYYQAFMCGSDATYGNKADLFLKHGADDIFDYYTAIQDGIIPEDHFVWWGMEDYYTFKYAKQKLSEISKKKQPFAFSVLTVDTHHVGGCKCKLCEDTYEDQYSNVISCSDRQICEFVEWIKTQDFYKNTTIVITGDHPSMDNEYVVSHFTEGYDRRVFNCFINSRAEAANTKNRLFSSLDMCPTILTAMGVNIKGDKMGLGVNLFSGKPTLCEQYEKDELNNKLAAKSDFYENNIMKASK